MQIRFRNYPAKAWEARRFKAKSKQAERESERVRCARSRDSRRAVRAGSRDSRAAPANGHGFLRLGKSSRRRREEVGGGRGRRWGRSAPSRPSRSLTETYQRGDGNWSEPSPDARRCRQRLLIAYMLFPWGPLPPCCRRGGGASAPWNGNQRLAAELCKLIN